MRSPRRVVAGVPVPQEEKRHRHCRQGRVGAELIHRRRIDPDAAGEVGHHGPAGERLAAEIAEGHPLAAEDAWDECS